MGISQSAEVARTPTNKLSKPHRAGNQVFTNPAEPEPESSATSVPFSSRRQSSWAPPSYSLNSRALAVAPHALDGATKSSAADLSNRSSGISSKSLSTRNTGRLNVFRTRSIVKPASSHARRRHYRSGTVGHVPSRNSATQITYEHVLSYAPCCESDPSAVQACQSSPHDVLPCERFGSTRLSSLAGERNSLKRNTVSSEKSLANHAGDPWSSSPAPIPQQQKNADAHGLSRVSSNLSVYTRRSIIQTPGVATRTPPASASPALSRQQSAISMRQGEPPFPLSPPMLVDPDEAPRSDTPVEADYQSIGAFKFGSLRITNGCASPVSLAERNQEASSSDRTPTEKSTVSAAPIQRYPPPITSPAQLNVNLHLVSTATMAQAQDRLRIGLARSDDIGSFVEEPGPGEKGSSEADKYCAKSPCVENGSSDNLCDKPRGRPLTNYLADISLSLSSLDLPWLAKSDSYQSEPTSVKGQKKVSTLKKTDSSVSQDFIAQSLDIQTERRRSEQRIDGAQNVALAYSGFAVDPPFEGSRQSLSKTDSGYSSSASLRSTRSVKPSDVSRACSADGTPSKTKLLVAEPLSWGSVYDTAPLASHPFQPRIGQSINDSRVSEHRRALSTTSPESAAKVRSSYAYRHLPSPPTPCSARAVLIPPAPSPCAAAQGLINLAHISPARLSSENDCPSIPPIPHDMEARLQERGSYQARPSYDGGLKDSRRSSISAPPNGFCYQDFRYQDGTTQCFRHSYGAQIDSSAIEHYTPYLVPANFIPYWDQEFYPPITRRTSNWNRPAARDQQYPRIGRAMNLSVLPPRPLSTNNFNTQQQPTTPTVDHRRSGTPLVSERTGPPVSMMTRPALVGRSNLPSRPWSSSHDTYAPPMSIVASHKSVIPRTSFDHSEPAHQAERQPCHIASSLPIPSLHGRQFVSPCGLQQALSRSTSQGSIAALRNSMTAESKWRGINHESHNTPPRPPSSFRPPGNTRMLRPRSSHSLGGHVTCEMMPPARAPSISIRSDYGHKHMFQQSHGEAVSSSRHSRISQTTQNLSSNQPHPPSSGQKDYLGRCAPLPGTQLDSETILPHHRDLESHHQLRRLYPVPTNFSVPTNYRIPVRYTEPIQG